MDQLLSKPNTELFYVVLHWPEAVYSQEGEPPLAICMLRAIDTNTGQTYYTLPVARSVNEEHEKKNFRNSWGTTVDLHSTSIEPPNFPQRAAIVRLENQACPSFLRKYMKREEEQWLEPYSVFADAIKVGRGNCGRFVSKKMKDYIIPAIADRVQHIKLWNQQTGMNIEEPGQRVIAQAKPRPNVKMFYALLRWPSSEELPTHLWMKHTTVVTGIVASSCYVLEALDNIDEDKEARNIRTALHAGDFFVMQHLPDYQGVQQSVAIVAFGDPAFDAVGRFFINIGHDERKFHPYYSITGAWQEDYPKLRYSMQDSEAYGTYSSKIMTSYVNPIIMQESSHRKAAALALPPPVMAPPAKAVGLGWPRMPKIFANFMK